MICVPLLFDIVGYRFLIAMFPYTTCKISIRPELTTPELFLYLGTPLEYFPGSDAFDNRYRSCYAIRWNRLHEKVHVILIRADLQEFHLVAFLNLHAYIFHYFIHVLVEYCTSVFCRKNQMVDEYRNIMAFMDIFAHLHILRRKRRGIQPEVIQFSLAFIFQVSIVL